MPSDPGDGDAAVQPRTAAAAERAFGAALLLLAAAVAWLARGYTVAFIADPVGPRAVPLLAAALIAAGATRVVLRPAAAVAWPPRSVLRRLGAVVLALALYPLLLPQLGFVAATGALMWALAIPFGGRGLRAAAVAFAVAGGMYALFVYALGVPLPVGRLFLRAP
jgi:putative tricarboxylic transport membrane protein